MKYNDNQEQNIMENMENTMENMFSLWKNIIYLKSNVANLPEKFIVPKIGATA